MRTENRQGAVSVVDVLYVLLAGWRWMSVAFLALAANCPATTGHMDPAKRRIRLVTGASVCVALLVLGLCWLILDRIPAERARKDVQAEWRQLCPTVPTSIIDRRNRLTAAPS